MTENSRAASARRWRQILAPIGIVAASINLLLLQSPYQTPRRAAQIVFLACALLNWRLGASARRHRSEHVTALDLR